MKNLFLRWNRLILLAALLLSGCFRPAGDSIQPTSDIASESIVNPNVTATSVAPAITLLSSDATGEVASTDPGPALTPITLAPATLTATATEAVSGVSMTLQIITPGLPLGPVTPDTPIPQPTRTATLEGDTNANPESTDEAGIASFDSAGECTYTIQPGDSLYGIALEYDTTVDAIMEANPDLEGDPPILQIEQVIDLPDCLPGTPRPTRVTPTLDPDATEEISDELPPGSQIHVVQPGDVLGAIATRYGVTVRAIMEANDMSNPDVLAIGQELIIPPRAN